MKKSTLSIEFKLPPNCGKSSVRIHASKELEFFDEAGNKILPEYIERVTHYDRPKGPKIQARSRVENSSVSIDGIPELSNYDSVFITDTNSLTLNNEKVSAACFLRLSAIKIAEGTIVDFEKRVNIYDFRGCSGNPELLAILKLTNDVRRMAQGQPVKIAFVTDTELGSHDAINTQKRPLYGNHFLPDGFSLMYASSDTGKGLLHQIIKFCDKQSSAYLETCKTSPFDRDSFRILEEDNEVLYKYLSRDDLEMYLERTTDT